MAVNDIYHSVLQNVSETVIALVTEEGIFYSKQLEPTIDLFYSCHLRAEHSEKEKIAWKPLTAHLFCFLIIRCPPHRFAILKERRS